jgi:hypothetical protein
MHECHICCEDAGDEMLINSVYICPVCINKLIRPIVVGEALYPVMIDREPAELHHLTIFFHGGSLSSCDGDTFEVLRQSLPGITNHFPNLKVLKIEVSWDINEDQETQGPSYIRSFIRKEIEADLLPLVDIPGAHKTCHDFFLLAWQLHEFCVENDCDVEVFSMDRFAAFNGKWEHDLEAAGYLFPNSNAWNPSGFQTWMSEYTATHYKPEDVNSEGEPIAVEYVGRAADLSPAESDGYLDLPRGKCVGWAKRYPAIAESQKAAVARETEEREATY